MAKRVKFKLNEERINSFFGVALIMFLVIVLVII